MHPTTLALQRIDCDQTLGVSAALLYAALLAWAMTGCRERPDPVSASPATAPTTAALSSDRYVFDESKMGAPLRIVVYAPDEQTARKAANVALRRIDELSAVLSSYDPNSEISRLNQMAADGPMSEPVKVSADLMTILLASKDAAERSGGAFDITVGPYMQLWRRSRMQKELPTPERLEQTRASVGLDRLKLDAEASTAQLLAPRMRLDVSGIAVGYILDQAMKAMRREIGVTQALIDAGGDVLAGDPPPDKPGWVIGLQSLTAPNEPSGQYVLIRNGAITTSGDTYRYVEIDGKRYSHIIDPKTGLGLIDRRGTTAIARNAMTADWLATAVTVLGPGPGTALAEQIEGAQVQVSSIGSTGVEVRESKGFAKYKTTPGNR